MNKNRNLIAECYFAGQRHKDWQEIEAETNNLVSALTYVILFMNDQVYNHILILEEVLKPTKLYRQKTKYVFNIMDSEIKSYNNRICNIAGIQPDILASITQSMEDDIKPHIDKYYYAISQLLLDKGVSGTANRVASYACTVNMLCQVSSISIKDFGKRICDLYGIENNPLTYLNLARIEKLSSELSNLVTPKQIKVNLNEEPRVFAAFNCIINSMLNPKVFENAFASY